MWMFLSQALLAVSLNANVGSAPMNVFAKITVNPLVRGETCLVWSSIDADMGATCWPTERNGPTVWKNFRVMHAGTYSVWVVAGKVRSNVWTLEVR